MILEAEKSGKLKPGGTILDFTSGNTGIATAAFANARGYKYVVVIQPGVSVERTLILKAYGVELLQAADVPGFSLPDFSASKIMLRAARSFTLPDGLKYSSLPRRWAFSPNSFS